MAGFYSNQLLKGVQNCLFNCGGVKSGMKVLILNMAGDPLNPVDEEVVQALSTVAQMAGASVQVLWTNGMEKGWWDNVPPVVLAAIQAADLVVNNTQAIGRPVKAVREAIFGKGVVWIRNMATMSEIMAGEWATFPFALSDEITKQVGERIERGQTWRVVHPNGTDISGKFGRPSPTQSGFTAYNIHRRDALNRPFPQGNHVPVTAREANGVIVTDRTLPVEARQIGVPQLKFSEPLKITIENNRMTHFEGGEESEAFTRFFEMTSQYLGDDAWNLSSWHSGIHPKARICETPMGAPDLWHRAEHNNPSVMHFHLGGSKEKKDYDYPFMFHISVELENATIYVDGEKLSRAGKLTVLEEPGIIKLASEYGDPAQLLRQLTLYN